MKHFVFLGMGRKKWTPQEDITDALLKIREKKKWQLAYRRYVLEGTPSEAYAPYFGLDAETLRKWFEIQFTDDLSWENFGARWQFDHIIPTAYFDYTNDADLKLCWSFINLCAEPIEEGKSGTRKIDLFAAKPYFEGLYRKTGFALCASMLEKIATLETVSVENLPAIEQFITTNKERFEQIGSLSKEEFGKYNNGMQLAEIFIEREILKKFS